MVNVIEDPKLIMEDPGAVAVLETRPINLFEAVALSDGILPEVTEYLNGRQAARANLLGVELPTDLIGEITTLMVEGMGLVGCVTVGRPAGLTSGISLDETTNSWFVDLG